MLQGFLVQKSAANRIALNFPFESCLRKQGGRHCLRRQGQRCQERSAPWSGEHKRRCSVFCCISSSEPVASLGMDSGVAGSAKRLKVFPVVCSTFTQRFAVVYLFNRDIDALLEALLAPGMGFGISLPDPIPTAVVFPFRLTIAVVFLIVLVGLALMVRTIALMRQLWTARVVTGMCWLSRH